MTTYSRARDGRRLALAGAAGTLAALSSIGLLATSAWLISRSAQHPPVLYLMVPVAAVQAFGIGRGFFRYAERLAGHDAALRILARMRMSAYDRLERLAPAGTAVFRSGDLISRLVGRHRRDDRPLAPGPAAVRGRPGHRGGDGRGHGRPAAGVGPGPRACRWRPPRWPPRCWPASSATRPKARLAPLRGELAAATSDLLNGAGELSVFSAARARCATRPRPARRSRGCRRGPRTRAGWARR